MRLTNQQSHYLIFGLSTFAFIIGIIVFNYAVPKKTESVTPATIWQQQFSSNQTITSLEMVNSDYLIIDFWATWCKPCVESLPYYRDIFSQIDHKKVTFVAINLDLNHEKTKQFIAENKINDLNILFDPQGLSERHFKIKGLPTLLIFDRDKQRVQTFEGFNQTHKSALSQWLNSLK